MGSSRLGLFSLLTDTIMEIYLDINCLADFDKKYHEVYGCSRLEIDSNGNGINDNYPEFVKAGHYNNLEWRENSRELLKYLKTLHGQVHIVINTASTQYNMQVGSQRRFWLEKNEIFEDIVQITSKFDKFKYANKDSILIDPDKHIAELFTRWGGTGVYHYDVTNTIEVVETEYQFWLRYRI